MAKDPAVLWYWNDWQGGTVTLSRHFKGCYMDLLHAQFNNGRLSLAQVKTVLGVDFAQAWPALQAKFKKDGDDNYYNEKAENEKIRRQNFTEGRKKNLKKSHMGNHMKPHMETVNETAIVVKDRGSGEGLPEPVKGVFTDLIDKQIELTETQITNTIEFVRITSNTVLTVQQVKDYWEAFKINQFWKHEWYASFEDVVSHFRNSLKLSVNGNKNGTSGKNNTHRAVITGTANGAGTI